MRIKSTSTLAALLFSAATLQSFAAQPAASQPAKERVEVVFVLDTTGSMADLIDGAKKKIWSIASTIVDTNPDADIAMGLVAYRDRGDDYITLPTALSDDVQGLYGELIKLQAEGGGDSPESVNEALDKAISDMKWTDGANTKRIVFLVGDAPPHMDYEQEKQYPAILKDAAKRKITVNAVQAGDAPETTPIWQEIAQYGGGRFIPIPQSGGVITVVVTPYDDDILELQRELDKSVMPYGTREQQAKTNSKIDERAAAPEAVQIDNSKFYSKRTSKKEVVTGGGDLIADIANKMVELERIENKELPDVLAGKSKSEIKTIINSKLVERAKLEARMAELIAKRDAFVLAEQAKMAEVSANDSFDKAVEETLKTQLQ
ncbi:MAG: vWA domain-containing protein [Rhizobiaceae bacterium]